MRSFGRRTAKAEVYVNVYDLHAANDYLWSVGVGAFHSGIEVHGVEYSFGSGGGVFAQEPKVAPGAKFRESVLLGEITLSSAEVRRIVDDMRDDFPGSSYNIISRNCNSFSNELCRRLLNRDMPAYINRAAWMGSWFSCLLPSSATGSAPVGGGAPSAGAGGRRAPPPAPAFAGEGRAVGATASSPTPASAVTDRREMMMRAALKRAQGGPE